MENNLTLNAVAEVVTDLAEANAPKKKAKKPAKESNSDKAKAKAQDKPAPVLFKAASGEVYELAAEADPNELKKEAAEANKALSAIGKKDADLLKHYLSLGHFQARAVVLFKSSKLYGQFLAKELPASQDLDPALRSNCKWLWEALNIAGHEGSDLLNVLGVNRIEDYKSKNPTVIKRDYKTLKAEAEKAALAEAEGVTVEELEAEAKAEAEALKEAAKAEAEALIRDFVAYVLEHNDKAQASSDLTEALSHALTGKKSEALAFLKSVTPLA